MADEKKMLDLFLSTELWVGGVIGAVLGVIVTLLTKLPQWIRQRLPIGWLMESLLDNEQACSMVVKILHFGSVNAQNPLGSVIMLSDVPNPIASSAQTVTSHPNIPEVIAKADMYAMITVARFLAEQGKTTNVEISSAVDAHNIWDKNIICIGGSVKADAIMQTVATRLVTWDNGFKFPDNNEHFVGRVLSPMPLKGFDYGIILKTTYAATGKKCFIVMGCGVPGTEASAYFLKQNAAMLGMVYGKNDFAVLVKAIIEEGPQSAKLWWFSPEPDWNPLTRWLYRSSWQEVKSRRS